ncbi:MAG: hypothetical protein Fur0022_17660 [Anaerolineales bacterium]
MNTPKQSHTLPFWSQLRWTLIISFVGIAVLPVVLVMGIALLRARENTSNQIFAQLTSISELKKSQIRSWLADAQVSLEQIVAAPSVNEQFLLFANTPDATPEFLQVQSELSDLLKNVVDTNPIFKEIFFYRADGTIIAASNPVQIGKLVTFQPYYESSLLGDYVQTPYYGIGSNELVMYISHAMFDASGTQIQAVIIGQLDMTVLAEIMTNRTGLGNSGETYLVSSESNYFLTPSRFESEGYIQARSYHSEGIDRALQGQEGFGIYPAYRSPGVSVLGVYGWIPELQAAILSEIDVAEGLLGYFETRNTYLLVAFLGATLASIVGLYTANRISKPITNLTELAVVISQGNLEQSVEISSKNEIGILANAFNSMTKQIRDFLNTLERRVADRTKALLTSAEVSRRLSNILDPHQLVLQVVEQVQEAFNYYHVHIYLLDEASQTLKMAGGTGEVGKILLARGHAIPLERGLVGRAARTKAVVWVPETEKEEGWLPNALLPETKSEIAVPIVIGDAVLGVLDVQNNVANSLTQDDADLLQAIANQVAVGLQNARQYQQTQRLYQAGVALLGANDPQAMLKTFMVHVAPQADQAGLLVFELSETGNEIKYINFEASWSRNPDFQPPIQTGTRFSPEQIPFVTHLTTGQTLIIANRETETLFPEDVDILAQFGLQSIVGLPLVYGSKTIGALLFGYNETHHFTVDELQPVQTLSNQMVILLQNLALFEQTQAALAQLDVLNRRLIGQGWQDYGKLAGGFIVEDLAPGVSRGQNLLKQPAENGSTNVLSEVVLPIAVRGHEIGHLQLQHFDAAQNFTEHDLTLLQEVANEVATTLENIRLLEQAQQNTFALEESRNLLNAVIDNLPLLLFVKDAKELRYVQWNRAGETILGISADEVIGKNAYDSFTKEEADRFTAQDWDILSGEKFLDISEETVETPRGTRILHTRKTPVYGADGQPLYLVGLSEDITERKQAEQAIRDLEALYRRAIAAADAVPYSRRYADETFTFIGDKIQDLTGYTAEEFTTSLLNDILLETIILSSPELSHAEAVLATRNRNVNNWKAEYRIRRKDGVERWLSDTSIEIIGPDGISTGSVGILTDITERKIAEETLNRQLREMENLNAIGQIVVTQQNLDILLSMSGQRICDAFNVDSGYVALYNPRSKMLQIPFYQDQGKQIQLDPQPLGVGLASRIVDTRQPLLLSDLTPEVAEEIGTYLIEGKVPASWLGVPILAGDDVLGVISVQHPTEPYWFKNSDIQFLSTIAATLSTAIQNIRLFEQTQNTLAQLENLTRRLTHESWQTYLETMPGEIGYIYDLNRVEPITTASVPHENGIVEQPLTIQGETIGRLVLAETEELDEEDQAVLNAVSKQLSAHLENLRLLEETERSRFELDKRAAELATVAEVATATATLLNPDELLQTVVDLTKSSFGLYHAHIYLLNENNDTLILSNGAGDVGYQMVLKGWHIPLAQEVSLVARAARERSGVLSNDVRTAPDYLPNPLLPNTRSELAVPLLVGERVLGVLDVQSDQLNFFTQEDIQIYSTLASQIAVALQNARLYVEQAATVQRLRELDHLKSSFLANMSHELRTPLNSIIGFTEIILEGIDGPLTEYMDGDLRIIQKNGKHLLSLINDVLDMAKIEAGRMNLTYERFMLSELIDDVLDITSSLAHDKQLYVRVESEDAHETELLADRIRLRQVLINIVGNAVKFTERGGITLQSEKKDGKLWLKIKDTGIGIPPNKLDTIFEAFSQVDTSTTRKAGGTGLGLPISRRLVELHHGQLYAESSGVEGEGSTFYLVLPLDNTPAPEA